MYFLALDSCEKLKNKTVTKKDFFQNIQRVKQNVFRLLQTIKRNEEKIQHLEDELRDNGDNDKKLEDEVRELKKLVEQLRLVLAAVLAWSAYVHLNPLKAL